MRKIKFRGKDTIGKWLNGGFYGSVQTHIIHDFGGYPTFAFTEVEPETVGQFSGMYDCEGNEIYDGDIIKNRETCTICKIIWKNGCWCVDYHNSDLINERISLYDELSQWSFKVVGNIHDNPELLKLLSKV